MQFTAVQQLPCLDNTDVAGFALYMKCLAEQVEGELVATRNSLNSFLNRPVAVWTNAAIQTGMAQGAGTFLTFNSVTSTNWPSAISATAPTLPNLRGWYYIGANVNVIASGVVSANTLRRLDLTATVSFGWVGNPVLATFSDTTYETNTGNGENLLPAGTVYFPGVASSTAVNPVSLTALLDHENSSTLNTTLTPAVRLWIAYLGDTPEIVSI